MGFITGIGPHAIVGAGDPLSGPAVASASSAETEAGWADSLDQESEKLKEQIW